MRSSLVAVGPESSSAPYCPLLSNRLVACGWAHDRLDERSLRLQQSHRSQYLRLAHPRDGEVGARSQKQLACTKPETQYTPSSCHARRQEKRNHDATGPPWMDERGGRHEAPDEPGQREGGGGQQNLVAESPPPPDDLDPSLPLSHP